MHAAHQMADALPSHVRLLSRQVRGVGALVALISRHLKIWSLVGNPDEQAGGGRLWWRREVAVGREEGRWWWWWEEEGGGGGKRREEEVIGRGSDDEK